jgi:peptidoglycan/LPS O-acetylase OafA/YrhL
MPSKETERMLPNGCDETRLNLETFDGIRGICAIMILVGHLFTFWVVDFRYVAFGLEYLSPVSLFFIISGFTLVQVYDPSGSDIVPLKTWSDQKVFLVKRMARLAPVYYFSLFISIVPMIVYKSANEIVISVVLCMFMIQSVTMEGNHWCGPLWTVSAFMFCYLSFPYMIRYCRTAQVSELMRMIVISYILNLMICISLILSITYALHPHFIFIFRITPFWMGVCGGYLARRGSFHHSTVWAEVYSFLLALNLIACAVITEMFNGNIVAYIGYSSFSEYILPIIQLFWMIHLSQPGCQGITRRVLVHPIFKFFGQISYSLYCTHWPVLIWCSWIAAGKISNEMVYSYAWLYFRLWTTPILSLICILFAILTYWAVERPVRQSIK